jgi:hypothetical protein
MRHGAKVEFKPSVREIEMPSSFARCEECSTEFVERSSKRENDG